MIQVIDNYDEVNIANINTFYKYGVELDDEERHTCVICGNPTSIIDSMSNQGHNLVCRDCYLDDEGNIRPEVTSFIWHVEY